MNLIYFHFTRFGFHPVTQYFLGTISMNDLFWPPSSPRLFYLSVCFAFSYLVFLHYLFITPQTVPDMMLIANPIGINEKSRLNLHPIVPPHFTFYLHCPSPSGTGRASGQCSPRERRKKKSPSTQECGLKGLDKKKKERWRSKEVDGPPATAVSEWLSIETRVASISRHCMFRARFISYLDIGQVG